MESEDDYGWKPDTPFDWWQGVKQMTAWDKQRADGDASVINDIIKLLKDAKYL